MRERYFRFKQFGVKHQRSAMKVGVDAVLLGAWADVSDSYSIIDVGCGCGVIALMLAQRNDKAEISGIDLDKDSVDEAIENVADSPWKDRINIKCGDFLKLDDGNFDHIISNPPYFSDGVTEFSNSRTLSRHVSEGGLSPVSIIKKGSQLLTERGKISIIFPICWLPMIEDECKRNNMLISRVTKVSGSLVTEAKRVLIEISKYPNTIVLYKDLVIEQTRGIPTAEYRELTKDFYLNY